jgi:hypothetical protein
MRGDVPRQQRSNAPRQEVFSLDAYAGEVSAHGQSSGCVGPVAVVEVVGCAMEIFLGRATQHSNDRLEVRSGMCAAAHIKMLATLAPSTKPGFLAITCTSCLLSYKGAVFDGLR